MTGFGYRVLGFGAGGDGLVGLPNYSINFANSSQTISIVSSQLAPSDYASMSVSLWVETDDVGTNNHIIHNWFGSGGGSPFWILHLRPDGKLRWQINSTGSGFGELETSSTSLFSANTPAHIQLHLDTDNATANDRMRMWIDGTEITSFGSRSNPTGTFSGFDAQSFTLDPADGGDATKIYQHALFNGLVSIGDTYDSGSPANIGGVSGLYSLLDVKGGQVEHDFALGSLWANSGTTASTDIPT